VFGRRILRRRIADEETLKQHIQVLERQRNERRASINWRFSTDDARIKLHHLYPVMN
jgi:hypothetical protein